MKRIISLILTLLMVLSLFVGCNDTADEPENTTVSTTTGATTETSALEAENENIDMSVVLVDILKKKYKWKEFVAVYPQYEITAQSERSMNVVVPEFENVIFAFWGELNDDPSEYKMASANAGGDVLLPEHYLKSFDEIIAQEGKCAGYEIADDLMQHLYKYEYIYVYREDFYYFIRGYVHSTQLHSDNIAIFLYDENHKRPW